MTKLKFTGYQKRIIKEVRLEAIRKNKKITIHDKHVFQPSKTETIWYKNAFHPTCIFDAGTPQWCGLMESEAVHIKKEINTQYVKEKFPNQEIIAKEEDLTQVCVRCDATLGHHKIVGRNCPSKMHYAGRRTERWLNSTFKKEESKMPRGVYPRHKQVTKKQKKNNKALDFIIGNDPLVIAASLARGKDKLTDKQLDMPFDQLSKEVNKALGLSVDKDGKFIKVEAVIHPAHYGGDTPYEVIKVAEHWLTREEFIGAMKFQVFKYTPRAGKKNPETEVQDHEKSIWYQTYLADFLKRNPKKV